MRSIWPAFCFEIIYVLCKRQMLRNFRLKFMKKTPKNNINVPSWHPVRGNPTFPPIYFLCPVIRFNSIASTSTLNSQVSIQCDCKSTKIYIISILIISFSEPLSNQCSCTIKPNKFTKPINKGNHLPMSFNVEIVIFEWLKSPNTRNS